MLYPEIVEARSNAVPTQDTADVPSITLILPYKALLIFARCALIDFKTAVVLFAEKPAPAAIVAISIVFPTFPTLFYVIDLFFI